MKRPSSGLLNVCVSLVLAGGLAYEAGQRSASAFSFPTSRDPVLWPFSADSAWNMPLATTATFSGPNDP